MSYLLWHEKANRFVLEEHEGGYDLNVFTSRPTTFDDGTPDIAYRNRRIKYYSKENWSYEQAIEDAKKEKEIFLRLNSSQKFTEI